jgi:hypothetical protein
VHVPLTISSIVTDGLGLVIAGFELEEELESEFNWIAEETESGTFTIALAGSDEFCSKSSFQ